MRERVKWAWLKSSSPLVYGLAVVALAVAVLLRWLLDGAMGGTLPLVTLFGAVAAAVWLGGYRPALLVATVGYLACAQLFIEPRGSFGLGDARNFFGLIAYLLTCSIIVGLGEAMLTAQRRAETQRETLRVTLVERRRLEESNAERLADARFLASIVESSADAIVSKSLEGVIQSWNAAAERLFGYTAEEVIGRHISTLIPPDRLAEEDEILANLRAGQRIEHFDTIRVRRDGQTVDVSLTISPIMDDTGRVIGASKIVRDISDRKRAEAAIKKQNDRLRLLSQAASVLLSTDDAEAMLRSLFSQVAPQLGLDAYFAYMVNDTGGALRLVSYAGIPEETAKEIAHLELGLGQAICGRAALTRQPVYASHIQQSDDREAGLVKSLGIRAYACNPLLSGERLLGTLSFASRSKDQFDDEELALLATISHYVGAAYERLRLLNELREADRRKDEFLATLAHELRGPLAPLNNMLGILEREGGDAELLHDANLLQDARGVMDRQVKQLIRLVDDLLDVGRITRNKLTLRKQRVELAAIIRQSVEACRPMTQQADHELTITLPPEPIQLSADPARLAQVFSNLLTNACKYTPPGGRIWLSAERQGSDVVVSVKDTGVGIATNMLPKVFEMFTQLDPSLESARSGLGIGLTLVKRLVEMHEGTIVAQSDGPGKGSEFIVRLPTLIETSDPRPSAPQPAPRAGDIDAVASPPRRILVVDDNHDAATSLAMLLKTTGNDAQVAHDGLEALAAAEKFRPEIALLDIGLPKLNGYDVARRIREQPWGKGVVLIATTGWGQEEDRRRSQEAGFDHHLVKPVDYDALINAFAEISPVATG